MRTAIKLLRPAARSVALGAVLAVMALSGGGAFAGPIQVTPEQIERLGIQTGVVEAAKEQTITSVLGRVTPALNARMLVTAPYAGTVVRVDGLEGQHVKAGEALASIASRSYLEARSEMAQQKAEYDAAKAAADRTRQLVKEGIAAEARAEEAEAKATQLDAAVKGNREALSRVSGVTGKPGEYRIVAPSDGTIASVQIAPGQMVEEMSPVAGLDTSKQLWIEVRLPASYVGRVKEGNEIEIESSGVRGNVVAVGNSIDTHLRSAMLRATIPADSGLVVGETVRISILEPAAADALNLPRNAVVQLGDGSAVFVAKENSFEPVPVTVLAQGANETTVRGAIAPGTKIAVSGLTELKVLAEQN
jgi:cobalt-zinc-cadmium efflux system membrane fusion protein